MPDLGITEILAIASLVAGVGGTTASIIESDKSQSNLQASEQAAAQAQAQQAAQQNALNKQRALAVAGPNAQAQTGGSLTGPGGQSFADILAGYAGATGTSGGSTPTSPQAGTSTPPNLTALLAQLQNGGGGSSSNISGGAAAQPSSNNLGLSPSY